MTSLALLPVRSGRWVCRAVTVAGDDEIRVRFETEGAGDWIEITLLPADTAGTVFRRFERCAVRYRGSLQALTPDRKA